MPDNTGNRKEHCNISRNQRNKSRNHLNIWNTKNRKKKQPTQNTWATKLAHFVYIYMYGKWVNSIERMNELSRY